MMNLAVPAGREETRASPEEVFMSRIRALPPREMMDWTQERPRPEALLGLCLLAWLVWGGGVGIMFDGFDDESVQVKGDWGERPLTLRTRQRFYLQSSFLMVGDNNNVNWEFNFTDGKEREE